jgi:hypothetical protein
VNQARSVVYACTAVGVEDACGDVGSVVFRFVSTDDLSLSFSGLSLDTTSTAGHLASLRTLIETVETMRGARDASHAVAVWCDGCERQLPWLYVMCITLAGSSVGVPHSMELVVAALGTCHTLLCML